jgi:hypothetical protein
VFTRFQLYVLIGCLVVAGVAVAAYELLLTSKPSAVGESSSTAAPVGNETSENGNRPTTAGSGETRPETPLPSSYFDLTIKSHTDAELPKGKQKIDANIELKYTRQKTNDEVVLTLYSLSLDLFRDGAPVESSVMTRDRIVYQAGGQKSEIFFDRMTPEQQQLITATFATELCKITLDADQNELGRQILSEAGLATLREGNLNTLQLMHGPYHRDTNQWQGRKRIPMSMGIVLDCPIEYTRTETNKNEITISGSLAKDQADSPERDLSVRNVSCALSGKAVYDSALTEYTSGELVLSYSFDVFQGDTRSGTLNGKLSLALRPVISGGK